MQSPHTFTMTIHCFCDSYLFCCFPTFTITFTINIHCLCILLVQSPLLLLARTAHVVAGAGRGVGRVGILFPASPHGLVGLLKNIIHLQSSPTPEADTPEFCYLLSSCSKRMIENVLCTIGENNFLDVKLFTPSLAACQQHCEDTMGCK